MRRTTVVSCLLLAGCASSNSAPGASVPLETVRVSGGGGLGSMSVETHPTDGGPIGGNVGVPLDRAWTALRAAYDSLAIPVSTSDPATHTMGNSTLRVRRRLGGVAMSKYLNCGDTQGSPSADSYEVQLSVISVARAAEATGVTSILTTVEASARPITLAAEYTHCTSKGVLESRIVELVKAQTGR
jgi:hypothetical protein